LLTANYQKHLPLGYFILSVSGHNILIKSAFCRNANHPGAPMDDGEERIVSGKRFSGLF
jgi:hypothetical protein